MGALFCHIVKTMPLFSLHDPNCHHLASVVFFFSGTTKPIGTKLGRHVFWMVN